ncbi:MAG: ATPase, partial [Spirochaetes bacterium]|nr:ATPase [Spirochaetota bacterium]
RLVFRWHISARREPVPDPAKSSEVEVRFEKGGAETQVVLTHRGFERHGEDGSWYRDAMASDMGWPRILAALQSYATPAT